ncbi:PREDICTED: TLC domain-containing protein At5g14285 [Tarenaya hassleriana]|uniref:TLC domain-containing protein At5g14285 n=1 Tax=Tarenaya hassleriana TaxID=28532 RepID=UPI00053C2014|nr:PREDICTED: TLC domain-containing protein At5g14285 [Tarenaya hassleriana]XP_010550193.1 PREDICTED: TLC domain-containing protein At5g14285 [Tarenaya hassleriana]XP_010550194.1 PREDICTED: TLC domain-containing protein At5g14285 [Tarenaya hassleriana]XP_010550195.1 PREDICTED: TLC domain-containing protein At5g14285 [Tarenaya hassleriana]XP_010550196.1 PREDICTED: TLC domain-containing protein At5g14285 [Tarenaya hassleriana]XP_010550197.1 PREDICTED: TLC domain-containing protein At5g14285 [Tar
MASNFPDLPLFFSIFSVIYLFAYSVVFRNWPPKFRPEASSCLISIFHGTPAVILSSRSLLSSPFRSFSSPNTASQNSVLDFSIAYFLADLLHYVLFYPSDVLFIGHHLATLFVFLTCRFLVGHGACAILGLLILAEVTSACQNAWTLARARRHDPDARFAPKVYDFLSPPFYAFYSLVRGVIGPLFVWKMVAFYAVGGADGLIPKWVWISWIVVVGVAISVSILWIWNLWVEFFRERKVKLLVDRKTR